MIRPGEGSGTNRTNVVQGASTMRSALDLTTVTTAFGSPRRSPGAADDAPERRLVDGGRQPELRVRHLRRRPLPRLLQLRANLVAGDTNAQPDCFVKDADGAVTRVSVRVACAGQRPERLPVSLADGMIAFQSDAKKYGETATEPDY
jgi:hypothetical protein